MNSNQDFEGKRFVVTGASSGLGAQITKDLAARGAAVLSIGRNEERLKAIKENFPEKITTAIVDVTDFASLASAVEKFSENGKINGCVHSAGIVKFTPMRKFSWESFEKIMKINFYAGVELIRIIYSKKIFSENCSMVLMSSVAGMKGEVGFTAYSASKGAVISAVKTLALELAPANIRVNSISPGVVDAGMTKTMAGFYPNGMDDIIKAHPGGVGSAEDVSNMVLYLLDQKSKWVTGSNFVIDGGYSIS